MIQSRLIILLPSLIARRWIGRQTQWWPRHKAIYFSWLGAGDFLSFTWPTGVQLLVFLCSSVPAVLFDSPGISRCRSQHVISVEFSPLFHHSLKPEMFSYARKHFRSPSRVKFGTYVDFTARIPGDKARRQAGKKPWGARGGKIWKSQKWLFLNLFFFQW